MPTRPGCPCGAYHEDDCACPEIRAYLHVEGVTVPCEGCAGGGWHVYAERDGSELREPCGLCRGTGAERCERCGAPAVADAPPLCVGCVVRREMEAV